MLVWWQLLIVMLLLGVLWAITTYLWMAHQVDCTGTTITSTTNTATLPPSLNCCCWYRYSTIGSVTARCFQASLA